MNVRFFAAAAAAVIALPALASANEYSIDGSHSSVGFSVKHMMVSTVRGEFGKVEGKVTLDDKNPQNSKFEATIDATTINTREPKRDEHLRSADFFDVEKFPTLSFKSTKVQRAGKNKFKVTGDLTMHGVTKPVTLDVESPTTEYKDGWGNLKRGATATAKVKRSDFGLTWNKALEAGGVMVSDEVQIQLDIALARPEQATAAK